MIQHWFDYFEAKMLQKVTIIGTNYHVTHAQHGKHWKKYPKMAVSDNFAHKMATMTTQ